MAQRPHVCIDKSLPPQLWGSAAERALAENPENRPARLPALGLGVSPLQLALLAGKRWRNGRTLRIRFMDEVTPAAAIVKDRVKQYALEWTEHANLRFEFVSTGDAEIRIAFDQTDGSWSYLGTDALSIPANRATMNFGWLHAGTSLAEYSRVVLHEFGHALGCIHEHQHPHGGIPWDKEAVYASYAAPPNNWSRDDVDANLFARYEIAQTNFSAFDRESIMLYPVPQELTLGDYSVGWNGVLSATDKRFIAAQYPRLAPDARTIEVDGDALADSIGTHGESDLFHFTVEAPGRFQIETEGRTDVVMRLLGPNNDTDLIEEDDDSGKGRNARIIAHLDPGAYYVQVRHYRPRGTGDYRIAVRSL
ncbi:MAG: pre-peptidase C-terminal domain-containing protein [Bryobacterales bacterium]|nr:pre-peptidase C-terminal domain-containing protein [Bryobacterales bacterium]